MRADPIVESRRRSAEGHVAGGQLSYAAGWSLAFDSPGDEEALGGRPVDRRRLRERARALDDRPDLIAQLVSGHRSVEDSGDEHMADRPGQAHDIHLPRLGNDKAQSVGELAEAELDHTIQRGPELLGPQLDRRQDGGANKETGLGLELDEPVEEPRRVLRAQTEGLRELVMAEPLERLLLQRVEDQVALRWEVMI